MTTVQAHEFLKANYSEDLVQQYIEAVLKEFPDEEEYWTKHVTAEERLREDMDLFVEALDAPIALQEDVDVDGEDGV